MKSLKVLHLLVGSTLLVSGALAASACSDDDTEAKPPTGGVDAGGPGLDASSPDAADAAAESGKRPGLALAAYTHTAGGADGLLAVDLDPESSKFGEIVSKKELAAGVLPHHHYFNNAKTKLYVTSVGPAGARLYNVGFTRDANDVLSFGDVTPIDVGPNIVGENIYFKKDDSKFYMTFMGGQNTGLIDGSIGVFDGNTNALLKTISAPTPDPVPAPVDGKFTPAFVQWPHGISADETLGVLAVTSTLPPDPTSMLMGNTVTTIDLATETVKETYLVSSAAAAPTGPMEVLITRDGLPSFAIVTTFGTGDLWVAPWDAVNKTYGAFVKQVDGATAGQGGGLQTYVHQNKAGVKELFVAFGQPGVVKVYGLDSLPTLTLKRTLTAAPGSHHIVFFQTKSGREVVAVENNLLNKPPFNAGTITVLDEATGELLKTLDLKDQNIMPESLESAYGTGYLIHH